MTLEYLREYRTYFHIGESRGISESYAYKIIKLVEDILIKDVAFSLPGRKSLQKSDLEYEVIIIDASEPPIERPKKNRKRNGRKIKNRKNKQKKYYSGQKKRHTIKSQIVADKKSSQIICTNFSNGKKHDFRLFKEFKFYINEKIKALIDTGFQGIHKFHKNSEIPKKKTKKRSLTKEEKSKNHLISSRRVKIENIIGFIKRFKILSDRYRNRRKRFGLRFNLISGICNLERSLI